MRKITKGTPPRLPWIHQRYTPPLYLVTFNTLLRRPILPSLAVHNGFRAFAAGAERYQIAVGRYVLMPDHIHLFVRNSGEMPLGMWVKSLKQSLSKVLRSEGREPAQVPGARLRSHWQPGFHDHLLRHDESYAQKWRYVHANPVRAGLVHEAEEWPYQGGEIVLIDRA